MPGLLVDSVLPDGNAAKAGICRHDVLIKYNDKVLLNEADLIEASQSGLSENALQVVRGWEILHLTTELGSLGLSVRPYPTDGVYIQGVDATLSHLDQGMFEQRAMSAASKARIDGVQLTTTPQLEGFRVVKTIGIVSAEYVGGMNIFRDIFASLSDLVGGRSETMQKELRTARESCMKSLKMEADMVGANAVIGVSLDYSEISGGGKSMLFLVASGTAVKVEGMQAE